MVIAWLIVYGTLFYMLEDIYLIVGLSIYCVALVRYLYTTHRFENYGLCKTNQSSCYFIIMGIPFVLLIIWNFYTNYNFVIHRTHIYDIIIMFFCVFLEEVFFRGFFWGKFDVKKYVMISSVLFAVLHLVNIFAGADIRYTCIQVLCAFCSGISLAILRLLCGSILPGIVYHFFINITSSGQNNMSIEHLSITVILFLFCMVYMIIIYNKLTKEKMNL